MECSSEAFLFAVCRSTFAGTIIGEVRNMLCSIHYRVRISLTFYSYFTSKESGRFIERCIIDKFPCASTTKMEMEIIGGRDGKSLQDSKGGMSNRSYISSRGEQFK